MRIFPVIAAVLPIFLGACTVSSGVLPAGPDTYTITEKVSPLTGGSTEAKRVALTKANDFCAEKGRVFVPSVMKEGGYDYTFKSGNTEYLLTFQCRPRNP